MQDATRAQFNQILGSLAKATLALRHLNTNDLPKGFRPVVEDVTENTTQMLACLLKMNEYMGADRANLTGEVAPNGN
jgi:hypothetical protein